MSELTVLEICAGGGGQALGLEAAGWRHTTLVDHDPCACETLRQNRPDWHVAESDLADFDGIDFRGVDLLAAGVPCPPFSVAGEQLGHADERDLFPEALRIIAAVRPRAVMFENVRGFATSRFAPYRRRLLSDLSELGYGARWRLVNAAGFGVPQSRTRFVLVALRPQHMHDFAWVGPSGVPVTAGAVLHDLMAVDGWQGAAEWAKRANEVAPTIVGGSKMHGGPDLGPRRARAAWRKLGVDGRSLADAAPTAHDAVATLPRLTLRMAARLQGFPDEWQFAGGKTPAYQQIGNAFPPPAAKAVAVAIRDALTGFSHEGNGATQERLVQGELMFEGRTG